MNRPSLGNGSGRLGESSSAVRIRVPASCRFSNNRLQEFPRKAQTQGLFLFFSRTASYLIIKQLSYHWQSWMQWAVFELYGRGVPFFDAACNFYCKTLKARSGLGKSLCKQASLYGEESCLWLIHMGTAMSRSSLLMACTHVVEYGK